jgi:hypothetical protein
MDHPITQGNDAGRPQRQPAQTSSRPGTAPSHLEHIPGWGSDLDRAQRPGVPMERIPPRLAGEHDQAPPQQPADVEVLHSLERPGLTPVFGTTVPPSGLSGRLRRVAFGYSESDLRHWLLLLMADRINMVEGVWSDLVRGRIPNLYKEMGGPAELRHNPRGAARKAMAAGVVLGVVGYALWRRRSRHR